MNCRSNRCVFWSSGWPRHWTAGHHGLSRLIGWQTERALWLPLPSLGSWITSGCYLKIFISALRKLTNTYFWSTGLGIHEDKSFGPVVCLGGLQPSWELVSSERQPFRQYWSPVGLTELRGGSLSWTESQEEFRVIGVEVWIHLLIQQVFIGVETQL